MDWKNHLHLKKAHQLLEVFSKSFIPNVILLIMQDWRRHRERPRRPYNETLKTSHPEMELIHEVSQGSIAAFLYRGAPDS